MGLDFRLRQQPEFRLDACRLGDLHGLAPNQAAGRILTRGRQEYRLDDWFTVQANDLGEVDRWYGELDRVDDLAAGWQRGRVEFHGSVGHRLGQQMSGGQIEVWGNVGDDAARGLQGGWLGIRGSAGNRLATALPGEKTGMTGGLIIVTGNVGDEVAVGMRRGVVYVGGNAGRQAAGRMLAGTLLVAGCCGPDVGLEMLRGSIVLGSGNSQSSFGPSFRRGTRGLPPYLPVMKNYLGRELSQTNGYSLDWLAAPQFTYWHGDFTRSGKGEILVAE